MSPEQAQGQKLDSRSDIYSMGVMFYEMLTGKVPFHSDNLTAILMKHINEDPVPPRKVNASIPPAIEKLILTALAKEKSKRFQSVDEYRMVVNNQCFHLLLNSFFLSLAMV
jgi:serine/threonine-protein kinase